MHASRFPELLEQLLAHRGLGEGEREAFLTPDYKSLHDPLLLPDMPLARDRVIRAVKANEHIAVYADYDADGIPGAVVLSDFFKRINYSNVSFYIPHRHDEGYGLNIEAIETLKARGTTLLITVDCGVSDALEIALANERGMDVIVTDHHEPPAELPRAFAIVNPKRADSTYPFKELCGSGVAYKLVQAILAEESFGVTPGKEKWSLDMVGIATLSDMVPLVGENRTLAKFGLDVLRKTPRPGLEKLFNNTNLNRAYLTEDDVGFMITPRINAASRMGVPEDAFQLLSTDDHGEAERLADHLEKINQERKGVVAAMVKAAKGELAKRGEVGKVLVIGNPEWKPSLLGLLCNSLVEEYERPVFAWGRDGDGVLKGSCRSFNGYNLHALMSAAKDSFLEFGGHKGAGGFSLTLEQVGKLEADLSAALETLPSSDEEEGRAFTVAITDVGEHLWQTVAQFAPFGTGNEKPVFKIVNAPISGIKQFGKEKNHLEITLGNGLKAISFFATPESYKLPVGSLSCTLHAHLEKSYFRNRPEIRLRIVAIEA